MKCGVMLRVYDQLFHYWELVLNTIALNSRPGGPTQDFVLIYAYVLCTVLTSNRIDNLKSSILAPIFWKSAFSYPIGPKVAVCDLLRLPSSRLPERGQFSRFFSLRIYCCVNSCGTL
jgi:hypothetical protein